MDKKLGHIGDTQTLVSGGEIQCMTHSTTPTASCSLYYCTRGRSITTGVTTASNLEVYDHWPSSCMSITVERVKVWCIVGHTWHTFFKPDNSPTNINQKCAEFSLIHLFHTFTEELWKYSQMFSMSSREFEWRKQFFFSGCGNIWENNQPGTAHPIDTRGNMVMPHH